MTCDQTFTTPPISVSGATVDLIQDAPEGDPVSITLARAIAPPAFTAPVPCTSRLYAMPESSVKVMLVNSIIALTALGGSWGLAGAAALFAPIMSAAMPLVTAAAML